MSLSRFVFTGKCNLQSVKMTEIIMLKLINIFDYGLQYNTDIFAYYSDI